MGFLCLTIPIEYIPPPFDINRNAAGLVQFDTMFNIVWEKIYGEYSGNTNLQYQVITNEQKEIMFTGRMSQYGWIVKTDSEGEQLWEARAKYDAVIGHDSFPSRNYLSGLVEIPSGSIFAVGGNEVLIQDTVGVFGFMMKATKDGCIDTICLTTSDHTVISHGDAPSIYFYPNPTFGEVQIAGLDKYFDQNRKLSISVYNTQGQLIHQGSLFEPTFSVSTAGLCFVQIKENGRILYAGKLLVER